VYPRHEMNVAVLGTGMVGRALAAKLADLGHDAVVGTRDVDETLARADPGPMGHPPYAVWQAEHANVHLVPFVMVEPSRVPGDHAVFVAGEDAAAKEMVKGLLQEFGWRDRSIVDLGGIRAARGTEMYLPLWLSLWGALGSGDFNIAVLPA